MSEISKNTEMKLKHSNLGLLSVIIGLINFFILIYFVHLLIQWVLSSPELLKNPGEISGTRVPNHVNNLINFFVVLQLAGFFSGFLGLFEKNKKKLLPIIGIISNGIFLLLTLPKI